MASKEGVKKTVNELMGSRGEANERRKKTKKIAAMAAKAVEVGSSNNDMSRLIKERYQYRKNC